MVYVILWTIDVYVHLLTAEHLEKAHSVCLAVRVAVVSFYESALWYAGVVGNGYSHDAWLRGNLQECLHAIECSAAVVSGNDHLPVLHGKVVTFAFLWDEALVCGYGFVATFADDYLNRTTAGAEILLEQVNGICVGCGFSCEGV